MKLLQSILKIRASKVTTPPYTHGNGASRSGMNMNRLTRLLVMFVLSCYPLSPVGAGGKTDKECIPHAVFGDIIFVTWAEGKTDREQAGLVGPVRTVAFPVSVTGHIMTTYDPEGNEIETAYYDGDGRPPYAVTVHTYDAQGKRTEVTQYTYDGSLFFKYVYTYNPQGQLTESRDVFYNNSLLNSFIKSVYTYDARGNLIEQIIYDRDSLDKIEARITYTYNPHGKLSETTTYSNSSHNVIYRATYTYGSHGKLSKATHYDAARDPILKSVETYDARGNMSKKVTYYYTRVGKGKERESYPPNLTEVYTYEFDARGNWIKKNGSIRLITYY